MYQVSSIMNEGKRGMFVQTRDILKFVYPLS